jgi:type II secretory pathway component PulK
MLLCVFVIGLVSVMVLGLLKTLSVRSQVTHRIQSNEQLFYAAEAGIQHAVAKLEALPAFTGTIKWDTSSSKLPVDTPRLQYTVIVADTADGQKLVTSRGEFDGGSTTLVRTLSAKGTL